MVMKEAVVEKQPTRLRMSRDEFLAWADEDTHAEWVDGEVFVFMPAKDVHQSTLEFLFELMALFVRLLNRGKVRVAPFAVKLRHGRSYREPDILFVAQDHLDRLTENQLEGPADLIVEIVSDDSVRRDRDDKYKEYQAAGVGEYWVIDPRPGKQRADFFRLTDDGEYELAATEDEETVESAVLPGFWIRPSWLWRVDEIEPLTALFEMRGIPEEQAEAIRRLLREGPDSDNP